jgi:carbon storage regulator CsrA
MLVLSRRPDEKILLPTVPAIIKVISAQANLVRLGFEAPSFVAVLREELCRTDRPGFRQATAVEPAGAALPADRHVVRDHLHNLVLGLTLLRVYLVDCDPLVKQTIEDLEEELQALRRAITDAAAAPVLPPPDTPLVTQVPA